MSVIPIDIDPVLVRWGFLALAWHGIFTAVGLAVGVWAAALLTQGTAMLADEVYAVALPVTLGGIIGARALFVAENWPLFAAAPSRMLAINEGGISVFGAVIGGSLAGAWYTWRKGLPLTSLADRAGIGFLVGQGIGRIGDIINGEHHGREAPGLPWSVVYIHPNTAGELGVPVHPAVAYEMLYDFVAALALLWLLRRGVREGVVYVAFLGLYGFGRLWVGFYRKDEIVVAGLGMAQLIGGLAIAVSLFWLLWVLQRQRQHVLT